MSGNEFKELVAKINLNDYELIKASSFEVGLLHKGKGVRTWFNNSFDGFPTLDHHKVQETIQAHEDYLKRDAYEK